jgi:hypothetical protein
MENNTLFKMNTVGESPTTHIFQSPCYDLEKIKRGASGQGIGEPMNSSMPDNNSAIEINLLITSSTCIS